MKALLCKKYGSTDDLVFEDIEAGVPGPGQVSIRVYACGVNFPDTITIQGKDQYKPELPFSPGGEYAGTIEAIGKDVKGFSVGDRVLSGSVWGGFREVAVTSSHNTFLIPDPMDFVTASVFICAYGTAIHCLKDRAQLKAGETVAILGASGGVGSALIQVAKIMGARVIACASTQEKLDSCSQLGADELVNYSKEDLKSRLKELTDGKGVDVMCDPVGGDFSEIALRSTAWNGRFMVLGFTSGSIGKIPLNLPLLKGCAIVGVFWSTFTRRQPEQNRRNIDELLGYYASHGLRPFISNVYDFEDTIQALKDLEGRMVTGKISVLIKK
ncbi:MAG: NADPH2:quinone reductase [Flavobacteriales bacterium]|jgi:NADPH2:quinone reductase